MCWTHDSGEPNLRTGILGTRLAMLNHMPRVVYARGVRGSQDASVTASLSKGPGS
jgi:hypothetical protein